MALVELVIFMLASAATCSYANDDCKVPAIFVFGDSLLDSGTNNFIPGSAFLCNFPPYGQDFFKMPTGRFSNGRHVADFLAQYLRLPFPRPFLDSRAKLTEGVNFASGGAGVLDSTNQGRGTVSLNEQVLQFIVVREKLVQKRGIRKTNELFSKSLFLMTIGSNDVLENYLSNDTFRESVTPEQFVTTVVHAYGNSIQALYSLGARKLVIIGLGPLGCIPAVLASVNSTDGTCVSEPNELAAALNAALEAALGALRQSLIQSSILFAKPLDTFTRLLQKSGKVGACCGGGVLNAEVQCGVRKNGVSSNLCSNPRQFVFWDSFHPTETAAEVFAQRFWSGDASVISPMNIFSLASR